MKLVSNVANGLIPILATLVGSFTLNVNESIYLNIFYLFKSIETSIVSSPLLH
jgi:hypothetical protein